MGIQQRRTVQIDEVTAGAQHIGGRGAQRGRAAATQHDLESKGVRGAIERQAGGQAADLVELDVDGLIEFRKARQVVLARTALIGAKRNGAAIVDQSLVSFVMQGLLDQLDLSNYHRYFSTWH